MITTELTGANGPDHLGYLWHADYSAIRGYYFQAFWFDKAEGITSPSGESLVQRLSRLWTQEITQGKRVCNRLREQPQSVPVPVRGRTDWSSLAGSSLDWSLLYLFRNLTTVKGITATASTPCRPCLTKRMTSWHRCSGENWARDTFPHCVPPIDEPDLSLWTM